MKKGWSRVVGWLAMAAGIVAVLWYALMPRAIEVDVSKVQRGSLDVYIEDDGETRVRERYTVLSPLTGKLLRVRLHPGDRVSKGTSILATIEPTDPSLLDARALTEAEARVKAAESALERAHEAQGIAEESLNLARREYDRGLQLFESQSIARAEMDLFEHRYRTANSEVRSAKFLAAIAEHELALARAAFQSTQSSSTVAMNIASPIDGVVLRVYREDAGFVAPGASILEIGDPSDMEFKIDVLSTAATRIEPGDEVVIEHWGGPHPLQGRVRLVEPSAFLKVSSLGVEEKRVNVIADFITPWSERQTLGDGFRIEGRIIVDRSSESQLKIPSGALFRDGESWFVFRWIRDRAVRTSVQVGLANSRESEILQGLSENEMVLVFPSEKVHDGSRVIARPTRQ